MALPSGDLLSVLQKSARNGTLLSSCEPEIQELMHQIDVLISVKQREWEARLQALRGQLQQRERELSALRVALQEGAREADQLRQRNASLEQDCRARNADSEAQVLRLRAELSRLSQNYEHMKAKRSHSERQSETSSRQALQVKSREAKQLKEQLEVLHSRYEHCQQENGRLENQLGLVRAEGSALQEKCHTLEGELASCRSQLSRQQSLSASASLSHTTKIREMEMQLKHSQELTSSKESALKSLQLEGEESRQQAQLAQEECHVLNTRLSQAMQTHRQLEGKHSEAQLQLKKKKEQLKGLELELAKKDHSLQVLQETLRKKDELIRSLGDRQQLSLSSQQLLPSLQEDLSRAQERLRVQLGQEKRMREEAAELKRKLQVCQEECDKWKAQYKLQAQQSEEEMSTMKYKHAKEIEELKLSRGSKERTRPSGKPALGLVPSVTSLSSDNSASEDGDVPTTGHHRHQEASPSSPSQSSRPAIDRFMQEVDQLVTGNSPDRLLAAGKTVDFVPLRPVRSLRHEDSDSLGTKNEDISFQTVSSSPLQSVRTPGARNIDCERFSTSLEGILGKHFEQLDQSLQTMLAGERTHL